MEEKIDDIIDAAWTVILADAERARELAGFSTMLGRHREQTRVKVGSGQRDPASTETQRGLRHDDVEAESAAPVVFELDEEEEETGQTSHSLQTSNSIAEVIVVDEYEEDTKKVSGRHRSKRAFHRRPDSLDCDNCLFPPKGLILQTNRPAGRGRKRIRGRPLIPKRQCRLHP